MCQSPVIRRGLGFTMIEVVMALAVIAIGLLSIISLIPIGAQAARTAISEGFAADISEHLLHYMATELTRDANSDGNYNDNWSTLIASFPASTQVPNITHFEATEYPTGIVNMLSLDKSGTVAPWNAGAPVSLTPSTTLYSASIGGFPVYRLIQQTTQIDQGVGGGATATIDEIDAVARIWKSSTTGFSWSGSWVSSTDATFAKRVQLNIELSWPGTSEFRFRQRAYYTLEVSQR
jgi:prepilin-type N-terminal cleavage/methylation domain-containing protein